MGMKVELGAKTAKGKSSAKKDVFILVIREPSYTEDGVVYNLKATTISAAATESEKLMQGEDPDSTGEVYQRIGTFERKFRKD